MSHAALEDTFGLMDQLDPDRSVPVLASHCGYRFGRHEYNLSETTIRRIAEREGVISLILSPYFLADGLPEGKPSSWEDSFDVLCLHIDEIRSITGSHEQAYRGVDIYKLRGSGPSFCP